VVTVERITDPARLADLAGAWDELIDERSPGAIFRSSAWLLPWWRWFCGGKQLCLYVATDGPRLIGVLPAYHERSPLGGRRLRLMGDGVVTSDYLGVIAQADHVDAAAKVIGDAILTHEDDVMLEGVVADDPVIGALRERRRAISASPDACPYVPIRAFSDFDRWLSDRPPLLQQRLKRRRRWLEKRPGFRIELLTEESEITAALPTLWRLHRARWATEGGSSALTCPEVEHFQRDTARALAGRGWARLYVLHADGAPRAAQYGFERGGRFLAYLPGSDPDWRSRSVGTVLLCAAVQDAFARGLDEFDLLRGAEGYKALYTSSHRAIVTVRAAAGLRARTLSRADRTRKLAITAAATVLPESARRRLRGRR
jgi:CelD/BcsL family acetyltransferase involved in cellulose biosynthesis